MTRTRLAVSYTALVALALGALSLDLRPWLGRDGARHAACSEQIPDGRSAATAWRTAELFVADVILARSPGCGDRLSTRALIGRGSPHPFSHAYPAVPIARASRDPDAREAVYILSRKSGPLIVLGEDGRPEIPFVVGVAAPKAGRGAYDLVLVVERGSWRVDRADRVEIVER